MSRAEAREGRKKKKPLQKEENGTLLIEEPIASRIAREIQQAADIDILGHPTAQVGLVDGIGAGEQQRLEPVRLREEKHDEQSVKQGKQHHPRGAAPQRRRDIEGLQDRLSTYDSLPPRVGNLEGAVAAIQGIEAGARWQPHRDHGLVLGLSFSDNSFDLPAAAVDTDGETIPGADRILVETDAPYLTPTPERNKYRRNEPAFVSTVLMKVAEVRGEDTQQLAQTIWDNTCNLFGGQPE